MIGWLVTNQFNFVFLATKDLTITCNCLKSIGVFIVMMLPHKSPQIILVIVGIVGGGVKAVLLKENKPEKAF